MKKDAFAELGAIRARGVPAWALPGRPRGAWAGESRAGKPRADAGRGKRAVTSALLAAAPDIVW